MVFEAIAPPSEPSTPLSMLLFDSRSLFIGKATIRRMRARSPTPSCWPRSASSPTSSKPFGEQERVQMAGEKQKKKSLDETLCGGWDLNPRTLSPCLAVESYQKRIYCPITLIPQGQPRPLIPPIRSYNYCIVSHRN